MPIQICVVFIEEMITSRIYNKKCLFFSSLAFCWVNLWLMMISILNNIIKKSIRYIRIVFVPHHRLTHFYSKIYQNLLILTTTNKNKIINMILCTVFWKNMIEWHAKMPPSSLSNQDTQKERTTSLEMRILCSLWFSERSLTQWKHHFFTA